MYGPRLYKLRGRACFPAGVCVVECMCWVDNRTSFPLFSSRLLMVLAYGSVCVAVVNGLSQLIFGRYVPILDSWVCVSGVYVSVCTVCVNWVYMLVVCRFSEK